jgi:hypothetical protein
MTFEELKSKYMLDAVEANLKKGALFYKVFNGNNVVLEGAIDGTVVPRGELVRKAMASGKKWDVISVFKKGKMGRITFMNNPGSPEKAKKLFGV